MKIKCLFSGIALLICVSAMSAWAEEIQQPSSIADMLTEGDDNTALPASDQQDGLEETEDTIVVVEPAGYQAGGSGIGGGLAVQESMRWTPGYRDDDSDDEGGLEFGGWLDQGFTANANNPVDRFNGVVGMNDRANEYQMNQLWFYLERQTAIRGQGWDLGGRVDVMYGTDAYFIQCTDGLEANWKQTERFYQMALPQFYLDIAYNDFTFTMGHFLSPLEWESYMAPENFFYSHSYAFMYGVPGTLTGGLLTWDFTDQAQIYAGFHRGSDQFEDTDDGLNALNFIGGASWESADKRTYLEFGIDVEEKGPGNLVHMGALSMLRKLSCRTDWMIEYVFGRIDRCGNDWYGINQQLVYKLNCCWSIGGRFEWFRDDDGGVVYGYREGNEAEGPFIGNFWELTLGVNYKPRDNFIIRNEIRYDWYTPDQAGGPKPFDSGDQLDQFLYAIDLIYLF